VLTMESSHGEKIIAGGRYASADTPRPGRSAELAFTTEESYQARGIAGLLLGHLVQIARENGVLQLEADVLAENRAMLTVFRRSGLPMQQHHDGDVIHVTLWLGPEKRGSQR
jgi:GNAT superfamily N-acetyltransferase